MISQAQINELNIRDLNQYFDLITKARSNWETNEMLRLMKALSGKQKRLAVDYYLDKIINSNIYDTEEVNQRGLAANIRDILLML